MQVYQKLLFMFGTNFVKTAKQLNQGSAPERFYPAISLNRMIQSSLGPVCLLFQPQFKEQASAVTSKSIFQEIFP